ncbi:hypothetical protein WJX73_001825 [Symbiochloris irregularis]|uniref:Secreted protein n=1 Tax=Symbiochloris irregularis TaxID=706552 RepID=A0AAW1NSB9_9CHLO
MHSGSAESCFAPLLRVLLCTSMRRCMAAERLVGMKIRLALPRMESRYDAARQATAVHGSQSVRSSLQLTAGEDLIETAHSQERGTSV